MSDDPFAAFKENQPPTTDAPPDEGGKNGRKNKKIPPKKTAAPAPAADAPKPKKERKTYAPRMRRPVMIPISVLPELGGFSDEEASRLMSFIGNLHDLPKKGRLKIVAALNRIFS